MLTGESVPVDVTVGDAVTGATVNAGGRLVVEATRVGADTQLARMARLVEDAQNGKAEVQRLADRISGVFVPVVLLIALGTFGVWLGGHRRHGRRLHRRRRGADHRLPVRAGPRHADRPDGRHGPRRPARHPHQGPRGPGVHAPRRHRRPGQDRHGDDGPHDTPGGVRRRGHRRERAAAARRRPGARLRASGRPGDRRGRSGARWRRCRRRSTSRTFPGSACAGAWRVTRSVGRAGSSTSTVSPAAGAGPRQVRGRGGGTYAPSWSPGTARRVGVAHRRRRGQGDQRARPYANCAPSGSRRCC